MVKEQRSKNQVHESTSYLGVSGVVLRCLDNRGRLCISFPGKGQAPFHNLGSTFCSGSEVGQSPTECQGGEFSVLIRL